MLISGVVVVAVAVVIAVLDVLVMMAVLDVVVVMGSSFGMTITATIAPTATNPMDANPINAFLPNLANQPTCAPFLPPPPSSSFRAGSGAGPAIGTTPQTGTMMTWASARGGILLARPRSSSPGRGRRGMCPATVSPSARCPPTSLGEGRSRESGKPEDGGDDELSKNPSSIKSSRGGALAHDDL